MERTNFTIFLQRSNHVVNIVPNITFSYRGFKLSIQLGVIQEIIQVYRGHRHKLTNKHCIQTYTHR